MTTSRSVWTRNGIPLVQYISAENDPIPCFELSKFSRRNLEALKVCLIPGQISIISIKNTMASAALVRTHERFLLMPITDSELFIKRQARKLGLRSYVDIIKPITQSPISAFGSYYRSLEEREKAACRECMRYYTSMTQSQETTLSLTPLIAGQP